jgi:hypothetical protein
MSSFEDNYDAITENNKNELLGLMNQMHALGPAFQAFHQICKQHKIKPLRKRKGQYNPNKRHLSAYNIFTQDVQKDKKLDNKTFKERSKLIGAMWKKTKANEKEHKKYKDMAKERKKESQKENHPIDAPAAVIAEPVKAKAGKAKAPAKGKAKAPVNGKAKAPVKRGRKGKGVEEKVVDPSEVSEDEVYMEDSDDDVFDSDDDVSD